MTHRRTSEGLLAGRVKLFSGKEVVLRIITLPQIDEASKKELIRSISSATNSQTAVAPIDRSASNDDNREIAEIVFRRTGLLYEPKRGEYSDAIRKNYIDREDVVERALFTRLMHMAMGRYGLAVERKMMRSTGGIIPALENDAPVGIFFEFYEIYREISQLKPHQNAEKLVNDLALTTLVRALRVRRRADGVTDWLPKVLEEARGLWADFLNWKRESVANAPMPVEDTKLRRKAGNFSASKWIRSAKFPADVDEYVALLSLEKDPTSDGALAAISR
ncbi:AIPR family protein [Caulobacter flavus]|uniref:AIPR family protein n=1 Tax=Caulobacter flavus TaxID=1679497 RepID=UPI0013DE5491|nr:AIPR family protein [Caulobacter flavus]